MADDVQSIRSLNWRELFPFINLFRAFRVAIHPSKLLLGFALLCLLYGGGRVLDWAWPSTHYAISDEIDQFESFRSSNPHTSFADTRDALRRERAEAFAGALEANQIAAGHEAYVQGISGAHRNLLQTLIVAERNKKFADARAALDKTLADADKISDEGARATARKAAVDTHDAAVRAAQTYADEQIRLLYFYTPRPLFDTFFEYEVRRFHNVVDSALSGNWLNGSLGATAPEPSFIEGRRRNGNVGQIGSLRDLMARQALGADGPDAATRRSSFGVLRSLANFAVVGPGWLLRFHFVYFILFASWFLVVWAIFGGAIARIAAVHIARDEKISIRQALRFGAAKLLSFVFAPLIPVTIIFVFGLMIAAGGLLLYIPVLGPIAVGAFFILALVAGLIITLVAVGTVGGFNLMYPTIAVEGSDSFDAISRSLSYVFARPWRMLFYTIVSVVYGSLCFIFVRYFVYLMLAFTHFFVQAFLAGKAGQYWPAIWPAVSDQDLTYHINYQALAWSEAIAATLIAMWVYLVLSFLAAFVVSFYFSSNTLIYFLMRREVDATELDDVYIEESEDDFGDGVIANPMPVTAASATPDPASSPAGTTPPDVTPAI
ncbi:MAG TPA: hypothetical protein VG326_03540 [Tepidisphaeraceae bacterium]|jgi:hypothetical protein|nr:hypothetical protein [Tepidisphaeraceae bacterium]